MNIQDAKFLVVDDSDIMNTLTGIYLNRLGAKKEHIVSKRSGDEVMEAIETQLFDVVVMDMQLQGSRHGTEVISDIKKIHKHRRPTFIACSGAFRGTLQELKQKGIIDNFINKPFTEKDMRKAILSALEERTS